MTKVILTPRVPDIYKGIDPFVPESIERLGRPTPLHSIIGSLEKRDQQLENALLGFLAVNDVSGHVGNTTALPESRQIAWSVNFGVVEGETDMDGTLAVTYGKPFPTDTAIVVFRDTNQGLFNLLAGSISKTGFSVTNTFSAGDPVEGGYIAVGY